ncbi:hypothetical protein ACFL4L_02350 [bacterium]
MVTFEVEEATGEYTHNKDSLVVAPLTPVDVEILDASKTPTETLQIALWDNAYDASGNVKNDFITPDTRCFYVRVTDEDANTDPSVKEKITVEIGTTVPAPWQPDDFHEITLEEQGIDSDIFLSEAQLLMSPDLDHVTDTDDDYEAYSQFAGYRVLDDKKDDRTHKCYPSGTVIAKYGSDEEDVAVVTEAKTLEIYCYVMLEPFRDTGFDHDNNSATPDIGGGNDIFDYNDLNGNGQHDRGEPSEEYMEISNDDYFFRRGNDTSLPIKANGRGPVVTEEYINESIKRANISWAQAEIKILTIGGPDHLIHNMLNYTLSDGYFDLPSQNRRNPNDAGIVYSTMKWNLGITMRTDILYTIFTGRFKDIDANSNGAGIMGIGYFPGYTFWPYAESFTFIKTREDQTWRVLAHEIGHILSKKGDILNNNKWIFFPQTPVYQDITIDRMRRITSETYNDCRSSVLLK